MQATTYRPYAFNDFFLSVVAFVNRDAPRLYSVAPDVISVQKSKKKRECTITVLLRIVYKHMS